MSTLKITSSQNPKYKYVRSLQKARNRNKEGKYLLEGRPELDHAFKAGHHPELVLFSADYISEEQIRTLLPADIDLIQISKALFDSLTYQHVPQNFLAVMNAKKVELHALRLPRTSLLVVLEGIEKPGNLGAVLRTADAVGANAVLLCESDLDVYNPNVLRNSRGASYSIPIIACSNQEALDFVKSTKHAIVAATVQDSVSYTAIDYTQSTAIVLGAESKGLGGFWRAHADHRVIIPMVGIVDSLNVSISAAILLYEAKRQRS